MSDLPRDHILRLRLTTAPVSAPVGVVEAVGESGKSALASELGATRGISSDVMQLDERHSKGIALLVALLSALNRAGMAAVATVVVESIEPRKALDALVAPSARAEQERVLVLNDSHHLTGKSGVTSCREMVL